MPGTPARTRKKRINLLTTEEERALIGRAAQAAGTDLTTFVVGHAVDAARKVLAERERFALSDRALAAWEKVNRRAARDLPGLRCLLSRRSPFGK